MSQALRSLSLVVALQAFWLATSTCAFTFETRADCDAADAGTTDETYAPSYVSTLIAQDAFSRYLVGKISWADPYYFSYYNKRLAGDGYGFEIETHFYNYDDAAAIGLGPAYMRGWTCESDNTMVSVACNTFPSALSGWRTCDLPACYLDTQLFSTPNSLGEYAQPILAFGTYDASTLIAGVGYRYGARGASGRGDRTNFKVNFQPTRHGVPLINDQNNQFACRFPAFPVGKDAEIVPFGARWFAPGCVVTQYKDGGPGVNMIPC
jgi:hypothetical protein